MSRIPVVRTACLAASVAIAACSQGPQSPSAVDASGDKIIVRSGGADGVSGSQSVVLDRIRVSQGARAFYAAQGGSYAATTGTPVEIWVEGSVSTGVPPRLLITWGDGGADNIGCGSCKLSHVYSTVSTRTVTVTLDDRVSATEKWTFTLNVVPPSSDALSIVFNPMPASVPIGTFVAVGATALYTRNVPVTLACSIVCVAGISCNIGLGSTSGVGQVSTSPVSVGVFIAATVEYRCTATAEDLTVSGVRQVIWQ